ncbi:MAG TPA: hypothetical protein PK675_00810 [Clostridia bacterium]|nr:hypothetical protein [Clostridia bacterium]
MNKKYENLYNDILPSEELKSVVISKAKKIIENKTVSRKKLLPQLIWCAATFATVIVFSLVMFLSVPRIITPNIAAQNDFYEYTPSQADVSTFFVCDVFTKKIDYEFINAANLAMNDCSLISLSGTIIESNVFLTDSDKYGIIGFIQYKISVSEIYDVYNFKKVLPVDSVITLTQYLYRPSDLVKYIPKDSLVCVKAYTGNDFNPKDAVSTAIGLTKSFISYTIVQTPDQNMP